MTSHAIHRTENLAASSGLSRLSRMYRHWRSRRRLARLWALDDRMLDDIGLTREDVYWAMSLPLTVNPAAALEWAAFRRRLEEVRKRG